jgi:D-lactate dehydrogenase
MVSLLKKAGYEIIFPENMDNLCCGTIWESKGMPEIADRKAKELEEALYKASEAGKYPVLCDQSPCLHRMRETIRKMPLYEPAEFIHTFLKDRLTFVPTDKPVALHITCSMRKMGLDRQIIDLAKLCSTQVLIPEEVGCCGFAGDKGFTHPEVNRYALRKLHPQIEKAGIEIGYSNSRTCEIGLTTHSGIPYVSIVYLVDQCTTIK